MSQRAVIVVDIQNEYFPGGKLELTNIDRASVNASRLIHAARTKGVPLFHVRHEMPDAAAPIFTAGSDGVQIHASVSPQGDEPVILKHNPNSFLGTDLKAQLDELGVEELVIVGAMSHMCIEATTRAAADFGYKVTVAHDACATMDLEFNGQTVPAAQVHATAMAALAFAYASIDSTDSVVSLLNDPKPPIGT